jgi:ABC-type dipeptide/oligopeptide/nickel transport system permease subunit
LIKLEKNETPFTPIAPFTSVVALSASSSAPQSQGQDKKYKFEFTPAGKIAFFGFGGMAAMDVLGSYALGAQQALPVGSSLFKRVLVGAAVKVGIGGTLVFGALTVGLLAGRGIDFLPTVWGGERISENLSKLSHDRLGKAPPWLVGAADFLGLN